MLVGVGYTATSVSNSPARQYSNFNLSKGQLVNETQVPAQAKRSGKLTPGVWQKEAMDTLGMFGKNEGGFSPVSKQPTLFDIGPVSQTKQASAINLDAPDIATPHWNEFRFFGQDTSRLHMIPVSKPELATKPIERLKDAVSATKGKLIVDGVTEMKEDQFPGRVQHTGGKLYEEGDPSDPKVVEEHKNAPNYRKVKDKPIHGVGQPTKKGFEKVLDHLGGKKKPIVWTNTRAEAVIYIDGTPYNLRQFGSETENLVLKEGASGAEVAAFEQKLKQRLLAKKSIQVPIENPGPGEGKFKTVHLTPGKVQTTEDVVEGLKAKGYKVQYKRIPLADEKSPTPAQLDELREWTNEARAKTKAKHPNADPEFVFNCHQGRGRTTTGMVVAGIGMEGKTKQWKLPFGFKLKEGTERRADRIINKTHHLQNLREVVGTTKEKAASYDAEAQDFDQRAARENNADKKRELELKAQKARVKKITYETKATDFTQRYATMQKYSEYIDKYGANSKDPSFDDWMKQDAQVKDLGQKWTALNDELGLPTQLAPALA